MLGLLGVLDACPGPPAVIHYKAEMPRGALEQKVTGCYRLFGLTWADSVDVGFRADTLVRLDPENLQVVGQPTGTPRMQYVNFHPFWPTPNNFDTIWWVDRDSIVVLEWQTPPGRPGVPHIYGGGGVRLTPHGDTLAGQSESYRDFRGGERRDRKPVRLVRHSGCP